MMYKTKPSTLRRVAAFATVPALFAGIALVNTSAVASVLSEVKSATVFSNTPEYLPATETVNKSQVYSAETIDKVTTFSGDTDNKMSQKIISSGFSDEPEKVAEPTDTPYSIESSSVKSYDSEGDSETLFQPSQEVSSEVTEEEDNGDGPYLAVGKMGEFPGGQMELMKFMQDNIKYPEAAFKKGIQGRVIVKFIITKNGKIESPKIVKGVDPELDAEAIRVVSSMPDWIPAENGGKPVASWFTIPVTFRLPDSKETTATQE